MFSLDERGCKGDTMEDIILCSVAVPVLQQLPPLPSNIMGAELII